MHISNSLNAEAVRLLAAVIWNSIKKPSGKRCNFEEKRSLCFYLIVAQNPTFFVILIRSIIRTHFAIPLNTVHFRTSIISHVFYALGHSVQKMAKKRVLSYLVRWNVDRENVCFNQKFHCVEGFEDFGSQGRTWNIANHALLFMVCCLHCKWKQPVAYYLNRRSTKAEMLVQFLVHARMLDCVLLPLSGHRNQQCQGHETFGFNQKWVILPVSKSSNWNNMTIHNSWSSPYTFSEI